MPNSAHFLQIRNAIYATLESELTNGRLSSVAAVGEAWLNEISDYPYVHVSWQGLVQENSSIHRRKLTHQLLLGAAYKSNISIADAYTHLYDLLDDGAGNGLLEVLNDTANYTWGGLASHSEVKEIKPYDNLAADRSASPNSFVAYGIIRYEVTEYLTYNGIIA